MTAGSLRVLWDSAETAQVTITGESATWTVGGNPVTFPYDMSSSTTFQPSRPGKYTLSVELFGVEIANTPDGTLDFEVQGTGQLMVAPTIDNTPAGNDFLSKVDDLTSGLIASGSSATASALSASSAQIVPTFRTPVNPVQTARRGGMPRIVSLITCTEDESPTVQNCTLSTDTVNWRVGTQAYKCTTSGAALARLILDPLPQGDPFAAPPTQAVGAWIYLEDATKVSDVSLLFYGDSGLTSPNRWSWGSTGNQALVNGWNFFRVSAMYSNLPGLQNIYRAQVQVTTTAATSFTVGHVFLECPEKAKLIIVADRGYKTFLNNIRPLFHDRGIPIEFALDLTLIGFQPGGDPIHDVMTLAEYQQCAAEGDSMTFHGYDGTPTASKTGPQLRADTAASIKRLAELFPGQRGRMWRAAFVQGNAPQWAAIKDLVVATAAGVPTSGQPDTWPPIDMMKIHREALDNNTSLATIDLWDTWLRAYHGLFVVFMHGSDPTYQYDVSTAKVDYFLTKLDAWIAEGIVDCGTFEQFFIESGGSFSQMGGATVATYTAPDGTAVAKPII